MFWNPLTEQEEMQLVDAIKEAELLCSAEIRVHLQKYCKANAILQAQQEFDRLKMGYTELRNGVLIYVAIEDHKFAIIGDKGIDELVPENFWEHTKDQMSEHFKNGELIAGIETGIRLAGEQLAEHFPRSKDDINELPDEISYGS